MARVTFSDERAFPKIPRKWGRLVFHSSRYGWVVRTAPGRVSPRQRAVLSRWAEWLRWANVIYKYLAPEIKAELMRQERISRIPARDIWMSAMNGLLLYFETDRGRIYSMAHVERISRSLDVFSQTPGAILYRGAEVWEALGPGPDGAVLIMRDGLPAWGVPEVAGGGSPWLSVDLNPPDLTTWAVHRLGRAGSFIEERPYGLLLKSQHGSGTNATVAIRPVQLVPPFDVVAGLAGHFSNTGDQYKFGVCLYSPVSNTAVSFDFMGGILAIRHYYNNFTLEGRVASLNWAVSPGVLVFLRIVQGASARYFFYSFDGRDWAQAFQRPIEHATEDLRFGVNVDARNASTPFFVYFVHWSGV